MPRSEQEMMEEDATTQSMTIANFSPQSMVMANAQNAQGGLLQSVMAAAANSGAETASERAQFGKQAANNLMQGMEKDAFEQNFSGLLEGLRTDIENDAEQAIEEAAHEQSSETPIAETQVTGKPIVNDDGTPVVETETGGGDAPQVSATTTSSAPAEAAPAQTQTSSDAPAESAKATPQKESVDVYV